MNDENHKEQSGLGLWTKDGTADADSGNGRPEEDPGTDGVSEPPRQEDIPAPEKKKLTAGGVFRSILPYVIIVAAVLVLNNFVVINARIPSGSMETTIMTGERVFGNRLAYVNSDPKRYDIIIFHYPDDESELFVKRIIGMPGDTVEILADGTTLINGEDDSENESFCSSVYPGHSGPFTVPEGCYFVMGDNRGHSNDSRFWQNTYVKRSEIVARAGLRYWPLSKIGFINQYSDN